MAPDAPTPDPSPAEVLADTLGEFAANEDWGYDASPLGDAEALIEALVRQGYEIVRKSDEFRDPTAIAEQRTKGWPDFHPEDFCHRCGHPGPWSQIGRALIAAGWDPEEEA